MTKKSSWSNKKLDYLVKFLYTSIMNIEYIENTENNINQIKNELVIQLKKIGPRKVAVLSGVGEAYLSRVKNGKQEISAEKAIEIMKIILECS